MLEVSDDSGLLALVVPATYEAFVATDWTLSQILAHFEAQLARRSLLIWGTGLEGLWKVDVVLTKAKVQGFRQMSGQLHVVGGSILLTNYESLTMAAQFKDVKLPEKHHEHLVVSLPDGDYTCRIIQMFDPEQAQSYSGGKPDFVIEVEKATGKIETWQDIAWFNVHG